MKQEQSTSLELSKKLTKAGCDLKTAKWHETCYDTDPELITLRKEISEFTDKTSSCEWEYHPAYDLVYDILIKYRHDFFSFADEQEFREMREQIMDFLNGGDANSAEELIWSNCVFRNKA